VAKNRGHSRLSSESRIPITRTNQKNDFLVQKFHLPRLAVEVNSYAPGRPAVDHHRLMLQGASIVRFANTFLDAYQEKRNFVFVAIFISAVGLADRYFMFQKRDSEMVRTHTVLCISLKSVLNQLRSIARKEASRSD
jgi:hypothetical protein